MRRLLRALARWLVSLAAEPGAAPNPVPAPAVVTPTPPALVAPTLPVQAPVPPPAGPEGLPEEMELYTPAERGIYRYCPRHDGDTSCLVRADPMVLWKRISAVITDLSIDFKVAASPSKDASTAHTAVVRRLREIFQLPPFEEGGLTESQCLDLWNHFNEYCHAVKNGFSQSSTRSNSSGAGEPSSTDAPPTPSSSQPGSAASDSSTAAPASSPTA